MVRISDLEFPPQVATSPALNIPAASVPEGRQEIALVDPTELEERRRGAQGKIVPPPEIALEARHIGTEIAEERVSNGAELIPHRQKLQNSLFAIKVISI